MDPVKPVIALIVVLAGGLLFMAFNHLAPAEANSHYGMMLDKHKLIRYAQNQCIKAIQHKLDTSVSKPALIRSDDVRFVDFTWDAGQGRAGQIACRYEANKGIADLVTDGKSLGPVSVDISENPAARSPGSLTEKHWGHW